MSITPIVQEFHDNEDDFMSMINSIAAEEQANVRLCKSVKLERMLEAAAKIITRLLKYADKTAERHPNAVTVQGQSARADAGMWLAQFNRQNH